MNHAVLILFIFLLLLVGINVGFALLERILAKKANRTFGLVLPVFFFILSVTSFISAIGTMLPQIVTADSPLAVIVLLIAAFLLLNIPTAVTYLVFVRVRRKMGDPPRRRTKKGKK